MDGNPLIIVPYYRIDNTAIQLTPNAWLDTDL